LGWVRYWPFRHLDPHTTGFRNPTHGPATVSDIRQALGFPGRVEQVGQGLVGYFVHGIYVICFHLIGLGLNLYGLIFLGFFFSPFFFIYLGTK
jgi:hypothetical protein